MLSKIKELLENILDKLYSLENRQLSLETKVNLLIKKEEDKMFLDTKAYIDDCGKVEP